MKWKKGKKDNPIKIYGTWNIGENYLCSVSAKKWNIGLIYRYVPLPLTHVCRIGLVSLPYTKQQHQRQHLSLFN